MLEGFSAADVAGRLGLQTSYVLERAKMVRLDIHGESVDCTTPKFAHDEMFCALVMQHGGYPVIDFATNRYEWPPGIFSDPAGGYLAPNR